MIRFFLVRDKLFMWMSSVIDQRIYTTFWQLKMTFFLEKDINSIVILIKKKICRFCWNFVFSDIIYCNKFLSDKQVTVRWWTLYFSEARIFQWRYQCILRCLYSLALTLCVLSALIWWHPFSMRNEFARTASQAIKIFFFSLGCNSSSAVPFI